MKSVSGVFKYMTQLLAVVAVLYIKHDVRTLEPTAPALTSTVLLCFRVHGKVMSCSVCVRLISLCMVPSMWSQMTGLF